MGDGDRQFLMLCSSQTDADELLGAECILCGKVMIRSLSRPFISREEAPEVLRRWQ